MKNFESVSCESMRWASHWLADIDLTQKHRRHNCSIVTDGLKNVSLFCKFIANDFVKLNDMNLTHTRTTLFVVCWQLSTSDSTQAPNFEAPMSYKQKWMRNRKVNHDFYTGNSIELFHVKLGLISELYNHLIVNEPKERIFWLGNQMALEFL